MWDTFSKKEKSIPQSDKEAGFTNQYLKSFHFTTRNIPTYNDYSHSEQSTQSSSSEQSWYSARSAHTTNEDDVFYSARSDHDVQNTDTWCQPQHLDDHTPLSLPNNTEWVQQIENLIKNKTCIEPESDEHIYQGKNVQLFLLNSLSKKEQQNLDNLFPMQQILNTPLTKNYNKPNKSYLGEGAYGKVKFGIFKIDGQDPTYKLVAVKKIKIGNGTNTINKITKEMNKTNQAADLKLAPKVHMMHTKLNKKGEKMCYLGMDLLRGGPMIENNRNRKDTIKKGWYLARALSHLHENGMYHHDVKGDNIYWDESNSHDPLKLLDFSPSTTTEEYQKTKKYIDSLGLGNYMRKYIESLVSTTKVPNSFHAPSEYYYSFLLEKDDLGKIDVYETGIELLYGCLWSKTVIDSAIMDTNYSLNINGEPTRVDIVIGLFSQNLANGLKHINKDGDPLITLITEMIDDNPNHRPTMTDVHDRLEHMYYSFYQQYPATHKNAWGILETMV